MKVSRSVFRHSRTNCVSPTLYLNLIYMQDDSLDDQHLYFSPEKNNVVFGSALDGWAFRLDLITLYFSHSTYFYFNSFLSLSSVRVTNYNWFLCFRLGYAILLRSTLGRWVFQSLLCRPPYGATITWIQRRNDSPKELTFISLSYLSYLILTHYIYR